MRQLTPRERTIARRVSQGWRDCDIAFELGIKTALVKNGLQVLYRDFGLDNRVMLAVLCITNEELKKQIEEG
jgi:DNA-binding NarL/FixJ family response regulator